MTTNEIKKGMKIRTVQLGRPVTGIMMDNKKGNTRLIETKGSEVGLFDEMGSVYAYDIISVLIPGLILQDKNSGKSVAVEEPKWVEVEHTKKQIALKAQLSAMGW